MINKLLRRIFSKKSTFFSISNHSELIKNGNISIISSKITLINAKLIIDENVKIENSNIFVRDGLFVINENSYLQNSEVNIDHGTLRVGRFNRIMCAISVRFGGELKIDDYNAINSGTEIRCDEFISIGSFNMISYNCQILDTNTHSLLPVNERREQTIKEFPHIGKEYHRPPSLSVKIGNDCWFGKGASILKGVTIEDEVVVGTMSVVTISVPKKHLAVGNPAIIKELTK